MAGREAAGKAAAAPGPEYQRKTECMDSAAFAETVQPTRGRDMGHHTRSGGDACGPSIAIAPWMARTRVSGTTQPGGCLPLHRLPTSGVHLCGHLHIYRGRGAGLPYRPRHDACSCDRGPASSVAFAFRARSAGQHRIYASPIWPDGVPPLARRAAPPGPTTAGGSQRLSGRPVGFGFGGGWNIAQRLGGCLGRPWIDGRRPSTRGCAGWKYV